MRREDSRLHGCLPVLSRETTGKKKFLVVVVSPCRRASLLARVVLRVFVARISFRRWAAFARWSLLRMDRKPNLANYDCERDSRNDKQAQSHGPSLWRIKIDVLPAKPHRDSFTTGRF